MRPIIILLNIILFCTNNIVAQKTDSVFTTLLQLEKQYYTTISTPDKTKIAFQKMDIFTKNNFANEPECKQECDRIEPNYLSVEQQKKYYWNAAMINLLQKDNAKSVELLTAYKNIAKDSSLACFILYMMAVNNSPYDSVDAKNYPNSLQNLSQCLQEEKKDFTKQNKKYNWVSYILPGGGMACKGYVSKGVSALVLNGLSAYFIFSLLKNNLYINALGYGMLTFLKFYQGNIAYTHKILRKKIYQQHKLQMQNCHQQLQELLVANPLNFKY